LAVAVDRQAQSHVDGPPNLQVDFIARAQHVVGGHRDVGDGGVAVGLEQVVAIEADRLAGAVLHELLELGEHQGGQVGEGDRAQDGFAIGAQQQRFAVGTHRLTCASGCSWVVNGGVSRVCEGGCCEG
jgi:hypothetical protein